MSVRRYRLAEFALVAAGAGLVLCEHLRASSSSFATSSAASDTTLLSPTTNLHQQQHQQHRHLLTAAQLALGALAAAAMLAHHPRREAAPLYVALLALVARATLREPLRETCASPLLTVAGASVALAAALVLVFPWPDLARLHGAYQSIGVATTRLGGLECRVLYPSAKAPSAVPLSRRASMLHHGAHLLRGMSAFSSVPQWLFGCLNSGLLAALPNAPVAAPEAVKRTSKPTSEGSGNGWPMLVFSHGLGGAIDVYSVLTQQLASEGYIVVVLNHCDGSASVTRKEDGRVEYYAPISREIRDNVDGAGFRFRNAQLRLRVQEVRRVLNAIAHEHSKQTPGSVFAAADLTRVSLGGHSFGAATALTVAHVDERVRAVVLLDAWMEPVDEEVKKGLGPRVPVFHLLSEHFFKWDANFVETKAHTQGCSHAQSALTVLLGTRHNNFCDLPVFSPLVNRAMKSSGSLSPTYALQAISQLSAAFLRGSHAALLPQFPEVLVLDASS